MIKDIIDGLTMKATENMSKLFHNPAIPAIYSLSEELLKTENELKDLKEKQGFETKKNDLTTLIEKLKYISGSIKDFTLFFIFIRRFYTLAIQKENFESNGKNISSKLIANLKSEEEDLYNKYIDGNCFSKVLLALSFECYQSYFKEYAKNFFESIQHSSDTYVNSLLILKATFYECTYFQSDNFNLTDFKFFLTKNIPINIPLPKNNYELVALRCFFFYELQFEFLKLKPVKTNFDHLKKAVSLELNITNYKASTKNIFLFGLDDLQQALQKIDKKHDDFLKRKSVEDKEADANHALVFYKTLENEIQTINKKNKILINNKYRKLEKMRRLLAIIVNEAHLPKFLEVFYAKMGSNFLLNTIGKPDTVETNKEALNYLFHAICRDEFYTPLNQRITLFINELTETFPKDNSSILDDIEFEDLIEFSFYYLFTLLYTDFNASLSGFNNKLLYTEMVTFNVFINFKLQSLEVLESAKNIKIKEFLEKKFKNIVKYNQHKQTILEEIKLNLETMHDIKHVFSCTKSLEASLFPKLEGGLIPMPEKNLLIDSFKALEKKQKICKLDYQRIEKHKFINKSKPVKIEINKAKFRENLEIENNKSIEVLTETLNRLSENLSESLKHVNETAQDINRFRQKISSALGKLSSSIQNFLLSLSALKNSDEIQDFSNLSLPKLLEIVGNLIIKNKLMEKKDQQKRLIELQQLLNNFPLSIGLLNDQVKLIINKYQNFNGEAKKLLMGLSTSSEEAGSSLFFSKPINKKIKSQIRQMISFDHVQLKEKFYLLERIIRIIKCDKDDQLSEICTLIMEADKYQNAFRLFSNKMHLLSQTSDKIIRNKEFPSPKLKETNFVIAVKKNGFQHPVEPLEVTEKKPISVCSLNEGSIQSINSLSSSDASDITDFKQSNQKNNLLDNVININPLSQDRYSGDDNKILITELEAWKNNFETWKYEKKLQLYELFNIVENSTLSILKNGSGAFLKILACYYQEMIAKKYDLLNQMNSSIFSNSKNIITFKKFLVANEQWLDETLNRMVACIERVHQSTHDCQNLIEISLRALLAEYFKISISYNNSLKNLMDEEEKLSRFHTNFTKQILPASSLKQMEETGNMPDFSKQVDKVNQLKVAMGLEYKNKQEIIGKLGMIAPDWLNYVKLIDPLYTDDTAENVTNVQPMEATHVPLEGLPYASSGGATATFYQLPQQVYSPVIYPYPVDVVVEHPVVQPTQIFYPM